MISNDDVAKVYNPMESISANGFTQSLFYLHSNFEYAKKSLQMGSDYYLGKLFAFLGYNYKGRIEKPSILHISTVAWIYGIIGKLKNEIKQDEITSLYFYDLLRLIKSIIVEENQFVANMHLLTDIYQINEPVLTDQRIFKIILVNIQDTKNQIQMDELDREKVTRQNFYDIILKVLRTAFNLFLNEFNSSEKGTNLDMLNSYLEEKAKQSPHSPTLESFTNAYFVKKGISENITETEEKKLISCLDTYYNFCETSFEDILTELSLFNSNSISLLYKIQNLISCKNFRRMFSKYQQIVYDKLYKGASIMRLEGFIDYFVSLKQNVEKKSDNLICKSKEKYFKIKNWIDYSLVNTSEFVLPKISKSCHLFLRQVNRFLDIRIVKFPLNIVNSLLYQPISSLTIKIYKECMIISISIQEILKENLDIIKEYILEISKQIFNLAKDKLRFNFIKFDSDQNFFNITLSKNLFLYAPKKFYELIKRLYFFLKNFDLLETLKLTSIKIIDEVKTFKQNVIINYKKFLALAEEKSE